MRDFINASGKVAEMPRFVATYMNDQFGRRVTVYDNFPHLDTPDEPWARQILCIRLGQDDKVVSALEGAGYILRSGWRSQRRKAKASLTRV